MVDEEEDFEVGETALSELGQNLIHRYSERFARLLEFFLAPGELDVIDWNKLAVEVTVDVCSQQNRVFRFKKKDNTVSLVMFLEGSHERAVRQGHCG